MAPSVVSLPHISAVVRPITKAAKIVVVLVVLVATMGALGDVVMSDEGSKAHHNYEPIEPVALPLAGSTKNSRDGERGDRKKSGTANEVFDGSDMGQMELLLSEIRQIRNEIREARKEHGRLASGVAEISSQVRVISDRKDQIRKKIRKLTKSLTKKDHHRKVKNGFRSLQQDHERILKAMSKAKLINHVSSRRNNRTGNYTNGHQRGNRSRDDNNRSHNETNSVSNGTWNNVSRSGKGKKERNKNNNNVDDEDSEENETEAEKPVVLPIELERKHHNNLEINKKQTAEIASAVVTDTTLLINPSKITTTTTTTTTMTTELPATQAPLPANCQELVHQGNWTSGVYIIQPDSMKPIKVWCDQRTDGGGWTMMVARKPQDAQEDFSRPWADYKEGFGEPTQEHWLGLDALHHLTKNKRHQLWLNITDWAGLVYTGKWKEFRVASESDYYALTVGRFVSTSTAPDALKWHNGMKFSTVDRDNDELMGGHCARKNQGGWWYRGYRGCYQAHPTGIYQRRTPSLADSNTATPVVGSKIVRNIDLGPFIYWADWRGTDIYPKTMFLMIRPSIN